MEFETPIELKPWWVRYQTVIGITLIVLILIATLILMYRGSGTEAKPKNLADTLIEESEETEAPKLVFDIAGAVNEPGVYHLPMGSIVDEAIKEAGGLSDDADRDYINKNINLAEEISDHSKIYIPFKGETTSGNNKISSSNISNKINLNTASLSQLDTLPGIGPVYAGRIIDYRESHGRFTNINELLNIQGIGSSLFGKLKDEVTI